MVGEEVASAQIEGELFPGLNEVDPEVVHSKIFRAASLVLEDVVLIERWVLRCHLAVGGDAQQLLEVRPDDILQKHKRLRASDNEVQCTTYLKVG